MILFNISINDLKTAEKYYSLHAHQLKFPIPSETTGTKLLCVDMTTSKIIISYSFYLLFSSALDLSIPKCCTKLFQSRYFNSLPKMQAEESHSFYLLSYVCFNSTNTIQKPSLVLTTTYNVHLEFFLPLVLRCV